MTTQFVGSVNVVVGAIGNVAEFGGGQEICSSVSLFNATALQPSPGYKLLHVSMKSSVLKHMLPAPK